MLNQLASALRAGALSCLFVTGSMLVSCSIETDCGGQKVSASPTDAKQRGFFIAKLVPSKVALTLSKGKSVFIEQAWLERSWGRNCEQHQDVAYNYKQIIVTFRNSPGLMETYGLGNSKEGSFGRVGEKALLTVFEDSVQCSYKAFLFSLDKSASSHQRVVDSVYLTPVYQ